MIRITTATDLLNRLAILVFDLLASLQGYRFTRVRTRRHQEDFEGLLHQDGLAFPPDILERISVYRQGGVRFIAYYKNRPAGTVRLGDPKVANRPFDTCGVDAAGDHFEIQNLAVGRAYREGSQFVMLGLFRCIYGYSRRNGISSWISSSMRNVYLTMRRYTKDIRVLEVDFKGSSHPVIRYLYQNNICDTCYTMPVASFSPWNIVRKHFRYKLRNIDLFSWTKFKLSGHESLSNRSE